MIVFTVEFTKKLLRKAVGSRKSGGTTSYSSI